MQTFKDQHPIHTDITVAWADMDALQHVNNVVYLRYFEIARIDFLNKINLFDTISPNGVGPVISENNIRYKRPVTFPDTLTVGVTISDIKTDRFVMNYTVFSHAQNAITTTGTSKVVMFDFETGQKALIAEPLLSALVSYSQDEQ
ncbi:acyl-CoA thioesterase [Pseudoalteromonas sp. NZS127_1]|jgi:acyl-CoA thioester hydrolase|uniref:Acyl-CoA thioester hydrolase n=2 Tax=Pseudoalteromonas arctica TaxID=394751 RepID=A0A290RZX1_9GAMM|nr:MULTISPECIES: thioesterase family protein [Pseudoalteromonas]ATC85553.1 acyl-CoA thioester hydrolase [Pseudoalteromonas arctica A 37-1-2]MBA6409596.1 acyl-CoA thioesterase [Pseudoalteromonas sp. 5Ae-yellow]MBG9989784.1 acyl-CoA thioesterase [Pseudoalteromonas sp. NZS37]MBG9994425.1 acyl-CoA thioesterase [Pseudoalteromonas sp. NZS127_1]MBG9999612.1 acyl-CoA thioesterase [Pseudoalteromonas sp. NSLLW24]|tara:strand:+ start:389 stop:823 length:435 start_codon:yes stop_codon:yes gene_type:complete